MKSPVFRAEAMASPCRFKLYRTFAHDLRNSIATLVFLFDLIERTLSQPCVEERDRRLLELSQQGRNHIETLTTRITENHPAPREGQSPEDPGLKSA